jgi:diguanylate cyclase (GGDEF)-like protein
LTNEQEMVGYWGKHPLLKPFIKLEDCWAFRSGNFYIMRDPHKDLICHHFESKPLGGYLCLPLTVQSQVIGMLNFNAPEGNCITSYQQQIINNFGEITKLSLANINLNEALREQAIHDPLTGLFNRRYLNESLPKMLHHSVRTKHPLCVCMIDLDYFKNINDQYGHDAGDEVLKCFGALLKNTFREEDIACRFGGEEFIIVLIGVQLKIAVQRIEQMRDKFRNTQIFVQDQLLPEVTLSIGIAEAPHHGDTVNAILHAVDSALYTAKESGRDKIVVAEMESSCT